MKASGLSQGTIYRLVAGSDVSVRTSTLGRLIKTLRELTGRQVDIGDLLEYIDQE